MTTDLEKRVHTRGRPIHDFLRSWRARSQEGLLPLAELIERDRVPHHFGRGRDDRNGEQRT